MTCNCGKNDTVNSLSCEAEFLLKRPRKNAVILGPFASLRVNFPKDPGSSRESVNRVCYGG